MGSADGVAVLVREEAVVRGFLVTEVFAATFSLSIRECTRERGS